MVNLVFLLILTCSYWPAKFFFLSPYFRKSREKKVLAQNLYYIYGLEPFSIMSLRLSWQIMRHQLVTFFMLSLYRWGKGALEMRGEKEFGQALRDFEKRNQNRILITGHVGNWELLGAYIKKYSRVDVCVLAKKNKRKIVDIWLNGLRQHFGLKVLWLGKTHFQRQMFKELSLSHWVCFVMDQKPLKNQGVGVNFLGKPCDFVKGPAQLASKKSKEIFAAFCVKEAGSYRLLFEIIPIGDCESVDAVTQKLASSIEQVVRRYPEQWCFNYKRWDYGSNLQDQKHVV
jgi:lauroyl/myristoyl acyltransferase